MTNPPRIKQLRLVVEAADYDQALTFYRDVLGMPELAAFAEGGDDRVAILDAGRATLELASPAHKEAIDRVETDAVTDEAAATGAELLAPPVETPWRSLNSRLRAPASLEITFFQELEDPEQRAVRPGFATDADRS